MQLLDIDEQTDFFESIQDMGFDSREFTVGVVSDPNASNLKFVFVVQITRDIAKTKVNYSAGPGTQWIVEFREDLEEGVFNE